ncbi:hypothetical protein LSH36_951g03050, partial [Paralvinella palmiformis]
NIHPTVIVETALNSTLQETSTSFRNVVITSHRTTMRQLTINKSGEQVIADFFILITTSTRSNIYSSIDWEIPNKLYSQLITR